VTVVALFHVRQERSYHLKRPIYDRREKAGRRQLQPRFGVCVCVCVCEEGRHLRAAVSP